MKNEELLKEKNHEYQDHECNAYWVSCRNNTLTVGQLLTKTI